MPGNPDEKKPPRNILPVKLAEQKVGFTRLTMWRMEKKGNFPKRVQLTGKKIGWFEDELDEWLESRPRGICARQNG